MFLPQASILHEPIFQFIICTPVFVCGFYFFGKSALKSIKSATLNMDVLITLGSTAAYIYSTYGCFFYKGTEDLIIFVFETSATIITLALLGNVLEKRSVKQTTT